MARRAPRAGEKSAGEKSERAFSKPPPDIELEHVDGERRANNGVGAQPLCGRVHILVQTETGADDVALEVGAAEPEIVIGESIDNGVRLQVLIGDIRIPGPGLIDDRISDGKAAHGPDIAADE